MFIQFLIEDQSGKKLIEAVMLKYQEEHPGLEIQYEATSYKGIGGYAKGADAAKVKSQHLLTDLKKRLRAMNTVLQGRADAALFIVLDNDRRDPADFKAELNDVAAQQHLQIDYAFCVAVEEVEAWLLGDVTAIQEAYPAMADRIATKHLNYEQDSLCGTWEVLAEMLTKKGIGQFFAENPTFVERGRRKSEWAEKIGECLSIRENVSPSFQDMLAALDKRLPPRDPRVRRENRA